MTELALICRGNKRGAEIPGKQQGSQPGFYRGRATFHARKIHHSQDLDPPSPAPKERGTNWSYLRGGFSERYAAQKSKMVSTGGRTTINSIKSLPARIPLMSRRQADCATLVT
jgi:hypothetical protein